MSIPFGETMSAQPTERVERRRMSLEEFRALPEGIHAEYIDGEAIMSPPATMPHQALGGRLVVLLATALPDLEVFQEGGMRTIGDGHRIPDVMAVRRVEDVWWTEQAPVVAIEVLSASTRTEDLFRKPDEYRRADVEQFWLVDRDQHKLTVLGNTRTAWDVLLEPDADYSLGEVAVGEYGVVAIDLGDLLRD